MKSKLGGNQSIPRKSPSTTQKSVELNQPTPKKSLSTTHASDRSKKPLKVSPMLLDMGNSTLSLPFMEV